MSDARFQDGAEKPLKLLAQDEKDLEVISTLIQDAIAERKEMLYEAEKFRFSILLNRFRWEDSDEAKQQTRKFERVQSVLSCGSVISVHYHGFDVMDKTLVFDLIGMIAEKETIKLVFAGEGEILLKVEAIDVSLSDVSRPYLARAQSVPNHNLEEQ